MSRKNEQNRRDLTEKLLQSDCMIRGMYLNSISSLESTIRDIVSYHFCTPGIDEKRQQFISIVLGAYLTRETITDLLEKLVNSDYQDLLKEYPRLFEELRKANEYAGWIYSASLDTSYSYLETVEPGDSIRLVYFDQKGHRKQKDVTKDEIDEKLSDCSNIQFALEDIRSEIRDRILTNSK